MRRSHPQDDVFGPNVRFERNQRAMSLRALSAASGVAFGHLSAIERGRKGISLSGALRIADALDVPLTSLLDPRPHQGNNEYSLDDRKDDLSTYRRMRARLTEDNEYRRWLDMTISDLDSEIADMEAEEALP